MVQTVRKKIRGMKDRLIKRERDSTIAAENNSSMSVTAGERGRGSWERVKSREMDWWRPERDRKWIYIHHSFFAPFDFWKGSRCASVHTAASIVAQWFTGLQMNMEQAQFATLAGSFPTERQTFIQSVTSPLLWKTEGGGERWGWVTEKGKLGRDREIEWET